MSKLSNLISEEPKLYQDFVATAIRANWLSAAVILCPDCVELYYLKFDRTGVKLHLRSDYNHETLETINGELDVLAKMLADNWKPQYSALNSCEQYDGTWALDLTQTDYAVLEVYGDVGAISRYALPWSFDGIKTAAKYISDLALGCFNPDQQPL